MFMTDGRWAGSPRPRIPENLDRGGVLKHVWPEIDAADELDRAVILQGDVGVGKTTIMAMIERRVLKKYPTPSVSTRTRHMWLDNSTWWSTVPDLIADIRQGWLHAKRHSDWGPQASADGIASMCPRLFLDDLGSESGKGDAIELFNRIIDARYVRELPTWFTTNLDYNALTKRYGQRTISRILAAASIVYVPGVDRRSH